MPKPKPTKRTYLPIILFLIGLTLILISLSWNLYQRTVLSFDKTTNFIQPPKVAFRDIDSLPQRIQIPKFGIDLPITESDITNGVWEINPSGGSHLAASARPGEGGNIVIYGHNKLKLFGKALGLVVGDKIELVTKNQITHTYIITQKQIVNPADISVLAPSQEELLTFYTCTGILDTKRFVVKAKPI